VNEAKVTIGATADGTINSLQKGNEAAISIEEMGKIIDITEKSRKEIFKKLEKYLK